MATVGLQLRDARVRSGTNAACVMQVTIWHLILILVLESVDDHPVIQQGYARAARTFKEKWKNRMCGTGQCGDKQMPGE